MKKFVCVLTAALMLFALTACGSSQTDESDDVKSSTASPTQKATDSKQVDNSKALVVYFSATGSTKRVAETIAAETGADLFEITPSDPYTSDDLNYNDENSRVYREHDDPQRNVKLAVNTPDNWESYDTVYLGYPIWWGEAAWPTESFVSANDFSGKTVYPFCTSASSGAGNSAENLAIKANGGTLKECKRFSSGAGEDEVMQWVDKNS